MSGKMKDKKFISQLYTFNKITPDAQWKKENREILYNQIFSTSNSEKTAEFSRLKIIKQRLPIQMARSVSQPAVAIVCIVFIIFGGGILSLKAARDAKPGDSLYIAKKISEKTQLVLAFSEREKARLGIEFAGNRAKEITQVLAEPNNQGQKKARVEKLVNDFNKEIDNVKTRLARISLNDVAKKDEAKKATQNEKLAGSEADTTNKEDDQMFSANLGKEENGIQISEPNLDASSEKENKEATNTTNNTIETTPEIAGLASSTVDKKNISEQNDPQSILKEAEELLNSENYNAILSKLDEAGQAINQANNEKEQNIDKNVNASSTIEDIMPDQNNNSGETLIDNSEAAESVSSTTAN